MKIWYDLETPPPRPSASTNMENQRKRSLTKKLTSAKSIFFCLHPKRKAKKGKREETSINGNWKLAGRQAPNPKSNQLISPPNGTTLQSVWVQLAIRPMSRAASAASCNSCRRVNTRQWNTPTVSNCLFAQFSWPNEIRFPSNTKSRVSNLNRLFLFQSPKKPLRTSSARPELPSKNLFKHCPEFLDKHFQFLRLSKLQICG